MKRNAILRKPLLLALAVTVILVWFAPDRESGNIELSAHAKRANDAQPVDRPAQTPETATREKPAASAGVLQIRKRDDNEMDRAGSGLFIPTNWGSLAAETEMPDLSPPPFVVLGRYEDENRLYAFLQYMNETLAVSAGDVIADTYRVEKLEGDTLSLLYLPLNTVQTLDMSNLK